MLRIDSGNATCEKSGCQLGREKIKYHRKELFWVTQPLKIFFLSYRLSLHPTGTPERIPLQNASSFAHHRRSNGSAASGDRFLKLPSTASTNNSSGTTTLIHQNGSSPSHSTNGNKNGNSPRTVFVTIHENEVTTKLLNSPNGSSASQRITSPMPVQA